MGISVPRLVLSGLVAGFIINLGELAVNVWLLGDAWATALAGFGVRLDMPAMVLWGLGSFAFGIVGVWIYAAIQPRYAPGGITALRAALALWAVSYLYVGIGLMGAAAFPKGLLLAAMAWGFVEMALAVYVGAWLYREGELAEAG
ncbi:MAG: hypothetical protein FIA95_15950 [Gemmatimonadetes bacterium]|nr:hypothetical protein [Gemmatimonadota bacterium]